LEIRVYYEDTDTSGFVYHSNYLNYCERGRSEIFFSKGLSPINGKSHFVVKRVEADYLKSGKFGDLLKVETEVLNIKGASIQLLQKVIRNNETLFQAKITLAHLTENRVTRIPEEIKRVFNI
jgi:acyl-CoA thioester hydrolase